jgi:SAM-dependent methyltransferase
VTAVLDLGGLSAAPRALWSELREAFRAAGFFDHILDEAEKVAPGPLDPLRAPLVQAALTRKGRPDADLGALFAYGGALARARAEAALGARLVGSLLETGLLRARGEGQGQDGLLVSELRITPLDGVWILSDELWRSGDPAMGPSLTTDVLRRVLPPVAGLTLLDVGCGAGTLAVWAASKGGRATGVDLAPRAIELSRLNALLNDVACELAAGDLTRPVAGRRFDLVVSQPPFLIKPPDVEAITYLHGGATGVEITLRLLSELEGVLAPGGRALVLFDAGVSGTPLGQRVMNALHPQEPIGLVLSICGHVPADTVAFMTASSSCRLLDDAYAAKARSYRAHLAAQGIERVAHALADVRRLPADAASFGATVSWSRLGSLDAGHLEAAWRGARLLGLGPEALLTAPLRVADGARLRVDQPLVGEAAPSFALAFGSGVVQEQILDEQSVAVLRALAERGTVAGACEDLAEPGQAAELHAPVSDLVRRLLLHGVVVAA